MLNTRNKYQILTTTKNFIIQENKIEPCPEWDLLSAIKTSNIK